MCLKIYRLHPNPKFVNKIEFHFVQNMFCCSGYLNKLLQISCDKMLTSIIKYNEMLADYGLTCRKSILDGVTFFCHPISSGEITVFLSPICETFYIFSRFPYERGRAASLRPRAGCLANTLGVNCEKLIRNMSIVLI